MGPEFESHLIPYSVTGKFKEIILQYLEGKEDIRSFFSLPVSWEGMEAAIAQRKKFPVDRSLLVSALRAQYQDIDPDPAVLANIEALGDENTFTICTAHQPNLLTGHLYFIYKILHTIRLAESLSDRHPGYQFVPVYFMGSEDADFSELNHLYLDGKKYSWESGQTGAFGRMKVDANLLKLLDDISGRLGVEPFGSEAIELLRSCFQKGCTLEQATFLLVHALFRQYGLVVFLPDNPVFKKVVVPIFREDIFERKSSRIVQDTLARMQQHFKVQAQPRDINLFYLNEGLRNRIVAVEDHFVIHDTDLVFDRTQMENELQTHPERFSPNVILRALFQEILLPDLAFIGGGGELSYWFELKDLFDHYQVPFPMLVLRNSFLVVEEKYRLLMEKLGISASELFLPAQDIVNALIGRDTHLHLSIEPEISQMHGLYRTLKERAAAIDTTLVSHIEALETAATNKLSGLTTKMLRAQRRKMTDEKRQAEKLKTALFPESNLQERTENYLLPYSKWGPRFMEVLFDYSLNLEQQFCVLIEKSRP